MIKAINTLYNGNYFRSRMEARWAVFFDAAEIAYQYEPEGFQLNETLRYLPDFYLPQFDCYAEIKPGDYGCERDIINHPDYNKWELFSKEKSIILLFGNPTTRPFLKLPLQDGCDCWCEFHKKTYIDKETLIMHSFWSFWLAPGSINGDHWKALVPYVTAATVKRFEHGAK